MHEKVPEFAYVQQSLYVIKVNRFHHISGCKCVTTVRPQLGLVTYRTLRTASDATLASVCIRQFRYMALRVVFGNKEDLTQLYSICQLIWNARGIVEVPFFSDLKTVLLFMNVLHLYVFNLLSWTLPPTFKLKNYLKNNSYGLE